jgi:asparagine synthetase B (glutamine-hydrolysing)
METFELIVKSIEFISKNEYRVKVTVSNPNEIENIFDFEDTAEFVLHENTYSFIVDSESMCAAEDEELEKCLEKYHKYEYPENLNPSARRMWQTAKLVIELSYNLVNSEVLNVHSTVEKE